jgi:hypothetical protein
VGVCRKVAFRKFCAFQEYINQACAAEVGRLITGKLAPRYGWQRRGKMNNNNFDLVVYNCFGAVCVAISFPGKLFWVVFFVIGGIWGLLGSINTNKNSHP